MESTEHKYQRAKKRVEELKGFYRHLRVFVLVNVFLYLFKAGIFNSALPEFLTSEPQFFSWVDVNLWVWGIILLVHALYVFRNKIPFLKKWEERQIQKIMEKEERDS